MFLFFKPKWLVDNTPTVSNENGQNLDLFSKQKNLKRHSL